MPLGCADPGTPRSVLRHITLFGRSASGAPALLRVDADNPALYRPTSGARFGGQHSRLRQERRTQGRRAQRD